MPPAPSKDSATRAGAQGAIALGGAASKKNDGHGSQGVCDADEPGAERGEG